MPARMRANAVISGKITAYFHTLGNHPEIETLLGAEMKNSTKRIVFTIIDVFVVLLAGYWVLWLCIYYAQTIDGAFYIQGKYLIFERNYLVPAQIFGITLVFTLATVIAYRKLRKKQQISRKYLFLAGFNTVPFWLMSLMQIDTKVSYWSWIY